VAVAVDQAVEAEEVEEVEVVEIQAEPKFR
jgi:hypothetical protein